MVQETQSTAILRAALAHVPFDGWSDATLMAAATDSGVAPALARALYPCGGVDLALAYHRLGDLGMVQALKAEDLGALRFRDRIARAVQLRLHEQGNAPRNGERHVPDNGMRTGNPALGENGKPETTV